MAMSRVIIRTLEGSPNEPDATCEACGAAGTVGRIARTDANGNPTEIHRFCITCWPEEMARYRARWREEDRVARDDIMRRRKPRGPNRGMVMDSATWHLTLELLHEMRRGARGKASPEHLQRIADEIVANAPRFVGEMPFEVEVFLRKQGRLPPDGG